MKSGFVQPSADNLSAEANLKPPKRKRAVLTVRMTQEQYDIVRTKAWAARLSMNAYALSRLLDKQP